MSAALPAKPSLEHLKKQAKVLLAEHADKNPDCLPILRQLHRLKDLDDQAVFAAVVKLADVQFALAMDYGFTTWDELLHHLEHRNSGLSGRAALAWAKLRRNPALARIIGGEARAVADVHAVFPTLELEGPEGRFVVEGEDYGEGSSRLVKEQRLGEFLNAIGVQAPQITLLEAEGQHFGVHRKIEGIPADRVELPAADLEIVANQLAGVLNRMHSVPLADACRILGWPAMTPEEAAKKCRFGGYLDEIVEARMAKELDADQELKDVWRETREWYTTFVSRPADLVFGHGDLWLGEARLTRTVDGYRLSGVTHLMNAGVMNLYDEFLRVASLGYFIEDKPLERAVIAAYHRIPGTRRVEEAPLRHAITAFWFYLAQEASAENRPKWLANAKHTLKRM